MILDFTDCKTVEEVNAKWLEYAEEIEPYKSLLVKIKGIYP
ncbi:unnamed protein product [marine sediment metagenome]|uniref:Uncharacterized protein n=1 Tax=marine sediment metagenome TaxID=412755 RepID=X1GGE4_9ZZZZ